MERVVAAALLVGGLALAGLGAPNVAASHYPSCPPAGPPDADLGPANADCAVYNTGRDELPNRPAPGAGCDGPAMAFVSYSSLASQGAGVHQGKYYVCLSLTGSADSTPQDGEAGLWKESNGVGGLQTDPLGGDADTHCSAEPLACAPSAFTPAP